VFIHVVYIGKAGWRIPEVINNPDKAKFIMQEVILMCCIYWEYGIYEKG
jgi:hypothetical protein